MRYVFVLVLAAAAATPAQLLAQDRDTLRVVTLDSMLASVTRSMLPAGRAPVAISALGIDAIRAGRATVGLDEALAAVPGVLVNNRYNFSLGSRIAIRGLGARAAFGVRGVRVIADGIPLTMPDGQSNLNNVDLGAAGRIEVIRGPASALYGNAAGGVIAIETAPPPAVPWSTEARLLIGDLGTSDAAALRKGQVRVGMSADRYDATISAARLEVDGFRDFSRTRQSLVNLVGHYTLDDRTRIGLVVNGIDQPVAESPGALPLDDARLRPRMAWPSNVNTGSGEAVQQLQAGVSMQRVVGAGRVDLAIYGLGRTLDNALPFGFIELERRASGLRALTTQPVRAASLDLEFALGLDIEIARDDRREFDNNGGSPGSELRRDQVDHVESIGPFARTTITLTPRLTASLGARFDAVRFRTDDAFLDDGDDSGDRTLTALSPVAGLLYDVNDALTAYANVATSFQTPTTTELINAPPLPGEPCCPGGFNTNLEPETATSYEVGVRGGLSAVLGYEVAAYRATIRNTLVPFQDENAEAREFFRNAGRSRHQGVEAGVQVVTGPVRSSLAYTYTDFRFIDDGDDTADFEDNRVPGVPPHHLFLSLGYRPLPEVLLAADLEHTSAYFANDANTAENPGASVLSLRAAVDVHVGSMRAQPFLALNNVTDERYNSSVVVNAFAARFYEPAPGFNYHIGVTIGTGGWGW